MLIYLVLMALGGHDYLDIPWLFWAGLIGFLGQGYHGRLL